MDRRKLEHVRDLRYVGLQEPTAVALELKKYPDCGIVQFAFSFNCVNSVSGDEFLVDVEKVKEALERMLRDLQGPTAFHFSCTNTKLNMEREVQFWIVIRSESALEATFSER